MILSREISRKGEAFGKPFHPLKTYPSRTLRPSVDYFITERCGGLVFYEINKPLLLS